MRLTIVATLLLLAPSGDARNKSAVKPATPPLTQIPQIAAQPVDASPGSLYSGAGRLADLARDLRASQVHDLITILVSDQASAVTSGTTDSTRKSSVANTITQLAGVTRATGPLANLANLSNNQQLQGNSTTSRQSTLSTTLTAEVRGVTVNGNLIIEGRKEIAVNGENQVIIVHGVVRADDVSPANTVASDQIAGLQISVNGKGVVGDAIKRPFILYRILLGLLPF